MKGKLIIRAIIILTLSTAFVNSNLHGQNAVIGHVTTEWIESVSTSTPKVDAMDASSKLVTDFLKSNSQNANPIEMAQKALDSSNSNPGVITMSSGASIACNLVIQSTDPATPAPATTPATTPAIITANTTTTATTAATTAITAATTTATTATDAATTATTVAAAATTATDNVTSATTATTGAPTTGATTTAPAAATTAATKAPVQNSAALPKPSNSVPKKNNNSYIIVFAYN